MMPLSAVAGLTDPVSAEAVIREIEGRGPAVVALSGGVDSAVVAQMAFAALGARSHALTLSGPAVSEAEIARARDVAQRIGIDHHVLHSDPLAVPEYRANPSNRCYFCRRTETAILLAWGQGRGIAQWLDGVHLDDLGDVRPGLLAMDQAGFLHPLARAGWRKTDVRAYARRVDLPNWDAPSDACLASRVAHGHEISSELLGRVAVAESGIRALGFQRVRVRTDGVGARIELGPEELPRLSDPALSRSLTERVRAAGFDPVAVDPNGYRTRSSA